MELLVATDVHGREVDEEFSNSTVQAVPSYPWDEGEGNAHHENEINFVKNLENSLDAPIEIKKITKSQTEQVILSYAETLHKSLKIMWVPMVYCGRMPFRLVLQRNRASIVVKKCSPAYISCFTTCVLTWIIFLWITIGTLLLLIRSAMSKTPSKQQLIEISVARQYWSDIFIFWTTLLQACVSTTHILYQAEEFAMFIKAWYRVLDVTRIEVCKTLKQYIIASQIALCVYILVMIIVFCLPGWLIHLRGTTWVIVIAFREPLVKFPRERENVHHGDHFFQRYAVVGLLVYLMAIIFSWMYVIQFMVFCRCFRKGLQSVNQRIAMILRVDDVPRVGPNALRLTYEFIHKDYLGIATTGIKIGRIFSWSMCNYYLWAILVVVVELGELFRFAKKSQHKKFLSPKSVLEELEAVQVPLPVQNTVNQITHLILTTICIFYVSYEGSAAHRESKMSYELARYKGLVDCSSQLERNFIRSIWIIVSEKCPVHVAPGNFFGITHSTVLTVFATAFTYFVFWAQSQTNEEDE